MYEMKGEVVSKFYLFLFYRIDFIRELKKAAPKFFFKSANMIPHHDFMMIEHVP